MPKELYGVTSKNEKVSINEIWARRQSTKTNGVSYITQRGAEAAFTEEGKKEIKENIGYYMKNAKMLKEEFENIGFKAFGTKENTKEAIERIKKYYDNKNIS